MKQVRGAPSAGEVRLLPHSLGPQSHREHQVYPDRWRRPDPRAVPLPRLAAHSGLPPTPSIAPGPSSSPAGSGGEAVVATRCFVLGLSAGGALQRHPPRLQASVGRSARGVDTPHLRASGCSEGPSRLRSEAVGGAQAAAGAATGQPGAVLGLPNVQALLDERAASAREAIQASGPCVARTPRKAREAARL